MVAGGITAFAGARLFDGARFRPDSVLLCRDGRVLGYAAPADIPADAQVHRLAGGILAPGFIDAQVNGGGGVMLNDAPTAAGMAAIATAHMAFGTTALLPTLISDTRQKTRTLLEASAEAGIVPGVAGLHLEGPHLCPARRGAHLEAHLRPLDDDDIALYLAARPAIGVLLVTLAAEQASPHQVARLVEGGVIVSIGHSQCSYDAAMALFDAGASGVTHLFNAMGPLHHRAPGLPGAALDRAGVRAGIIADGHHVDPVMLRLALAASHGSDRLFYVTDAMSTVGSGVAGAGSTVGSDAAGAGATIGSDAAGFTLDGRPVSRHPAADGRASRLTLPDDTLAGSDLDMASAVAFGVRMLDLSLARSLRMATAIPADFLRLEDRGTLAIGARADMVHLSDALTVDAVWRMGVAMALTG